MRRLVALLLFVVGYFAIVALEPAVAAMPAFAAFAAGGSLLVGGHAAARTTSA